MKPPALFLSPLQHFAIDDLFIFVIIEACGYANKKYSLS